MGYTLEQLQQMGAKPINTPVMPLSNTNIGSTPKKSYTLQELQALGAKPITAPKAPISPPKKEGFFKRLVGNVKEGFRETIKHPLKSATKYALTSQASPIPALQEATMATELLSKPKLLGPNGPSSINFQAPKGALSSILEGTAKGFQEAGLDLQELGTRAISGVNKVADSIVPPQENKSGVSKFMDARPEFIKGTPENDALHQELKAKGAYENVAKFGVEVIPWFLGEGEALAAEKLIALKGGKAIPEIASMIAKIPGLEAKATEYASKIVSGGSKSIAQALLGLGVAGAQSGGDVKETLAGGAIGAVTPPVFDVLGAGAKAGGRKVADLFSRGIKKATSIDQGAVDAFAREGIKAPISAVTKSPFLRSIEALSSKTAFGKNVADIANKATADLDQKVVDLVEKTIPARGASAENIGKDIQAGLNEYKKGISDEADKIIESIKPDKVLSDEETGKKIQQGLVNFENNFKITEGKVYDDFAKAYGGAKTNPQTTREVVTDIVKQHGLDDFGRLDPRIQEMYNRYSGANDKELKSLYSQLDEFIKTTAGNPNEGSKKIIDDLKNEIALKESKYNEALSFDRLKRTRTSVGEALAKEPDNGSLKRLYGALSEDMQKAVRDFAAGPKGTRTKQAGEAIMALDALNEGYASGIRKIESNIASSIRQSNPETIARNLTQRNSADTLKVVKKMVGDDAFLNIKSAFLRNLFEDSTQSGKFNYEKFKTNLSKYDKETIDQLLSKEEQVKLNNAKDALGLVETAKQTPEYKIAEELSKKNPEIVAKEITKRNSAETLKALKKIVGPERFQAVADAFTRDLFETSIKHAKFDVDMFEKKLASYDEATLKELLHVNDKKALDESIQEFRKYKNLGEKLKEGQKMATNSPTAFLQKSNAQIARVSAFTGALLGGHWAIAGVLAAETGGEYLFSKIFSSDAGRRLLMEGKLKAPEFLKKLDAFNLTTGQKNLLLKAMGYKTLNDIISKKKD